MARDSLKTHIPLLVWVGSGGLKKELLVRTADISFLYSYRHFYGETGQMVDGCWWDANERTCGRDSSTFSSSLFCVRFFLLPSKCPPPPASLARGWGLRSNSVHGETFMLTLTDWILKLVYQLGR